MFSDFPVLSKFLTEASNCPFSIPATQRLEEQYAEVLESFSLDAEEAKQNLLLPSLEQINNLHERIIESSQNSSGDQNSVIEEFNNTMQALVKFLVNFIGKAISIKPEVYASGDLLIREVDCEPGERIHQIESEKTEEKNPSPYSWLGLFNRQKNQPKILRLTTSGGTNFELDLDENSKVKKLHVSDQSQDFGNINVAKNFVYDMRGEYPSVSKSVTTSQRNKI